MAKVKKIEMIFPYNTKGYRVNSNTFIRGTNTFTRMFNENEIEVSKIQIHAKITKLSTRYRSKISIIIKIFICISIWTYA